MGGLGRRLERLEERAGLNRPERSEEYEKQQWLLRVRVRRNHEKDRKAWHVRDCIKLFRCQGVLDGMTTEDLRTRLRAWRPELDRMAIERELAKFIYDQEEGTESMVCPPTWRAAFVAADELRAKYAAVPDEVLAQWAIMQHDQEEGGSREEVAQKIAVDGERWGITEELMLRAIGPDVEEITDEERTQRLRQALAESYYGEQGFRVQRHISRLLQERL